MEIKKQVENAILLYEQQNIPALQQQLYELYINFNKKGGGQLIINYPDKCQLAECFIYMLEYDWEHDSDIREVWAENAFYCIITCLNHPKSAREFIISNIYLFLLLYHGYNDLKPKVEDILQKSLRLRNLYFDGDDYKNGAEFVINQFLYFSAKVIEIATKNYSQPPQHDKMYERLQEVLQWKEIENIEAQRITQKAVFIADVIRSILMST